MPPSVASIGTRALLAVCEARGLDPAAMLARAGLTAAQVDDPDGRLSPESVALLWGDAIAKTGDPGLASRAAAAVPFGAYRLVDFLAASAPTVGEAFVRVARYFPLINGNLLLQLHDDRAGRRVELTTRDGSALLRPHAEYALVVTVLQVRRATGGDWPLVAADFAFAADAGAAAPAEVLGCPVRFGRPRHEVMLAPAVWARPSRSASSALLATLEAHADRLMASLRAGEALEAEVTRALADALRGGEPTLAAVAGRLGMSARTLQRRLRDEGTTFADVLDRTRKAFAGAYLRDPGLAVTEVAYLLGFSEPSAFTRAFQRWYGVSPSRYRQDS